MADGIGCKCFARSEDECGCDNVDWTPQEWIDLKEEAIRLKKEVQDLKEELTSIKSDYLKSKESLK